MKKAFITGITGQDGSYLAEFLLKKNYQVFGLTRRTSTSNHGRIKNIINDITLFSGDLLDQHSMSYAIKEAQPDEVYNLAAQSFVPASWSQPVLTGEFTALGVTRILEALRIAKPDAKFYQASSSEMFGKVRQTPQNEDTPFYPRSPYGVAKVYGHWITINYRESFNMFAVSGILFNHESERRGLEFVTRKIANAVARIKLGKQQKLKLGNLESKRDWGYAPDYVKAMWLMLQQDKPQDFVIATGKTWSVKQCADIAFKAVGLNWEDYIETDKQFMRPAEVDLLVGDAGKAKKILGWQPKTSFKQMMEIMVKAELEKEKNS
ncbi:MAG: GDP-mannose 4,6-dehydratase [Candidatus Beckwithbacteria bacterium]|nr:GDP-mannose 4,6-dehydratase [Patescibacteria group bacterium]